MAKKVSFALAVAVIVAWASLFFSGRGVLIGYTEPEGGIGMLSCRYFTGGGFAERKFLYTKLGGLGRDTCPRMQDIAK